MSACPMPLKKHCLICSLTRELLTGDKLEYPRSHFIRLALSSFLQQRESPFRHLGLRREWGCVFRGKVWNRFSLIAPYEPNVLVWASIIQAIGVLMNRPQGRIETISIFSLEMLRSLYYSLTLIHLTKVFCVKDTESPLSLSICLSSALNSGH